MEARYRAYHRGKGIGVRRLRGQHPLVYDHDARNRRARCALYAVLIGLESRGVWRWERLTSQHLDEMLAGHRTGLLWNGGGRVVRKRQPLKRAAVAYTSLDHFSRYGRQEPGIASNRPPTFKGVGVMRTGIFGGYGRMD